MTTIVVYHELINHSMIVQHSSNNANHSMIVQHSSNNANHSYEERPRNVDHLERNGEVAASETAAHPRNTANAAMAQQPGRGSAPAPGPVAARHSRWSGRRLACRAGGEAHSLACQRPVGRLQHLHGVAVAAAKPVFTAPLPRNEAARSRNADPVPEAGSRTRTTQALATGLTRNHTG